MKGMGTDALFNPPPRSHKNQSPRETDTQQSGEPEQEQWVKATYLLSPHNITILEELKLTIWKQTRAKIDKSQLMREAVGLLKKRYDRKFASR